MRARGRSARGAWATAVTVAGAGLALSCATEQVVVAPAVRPAPRAPQGRTRCTHALERLALADGAPGDFLVIRSEVDGYALRLPGARDWRVRCDNPPASSGGSGAGAGAGAESDDVVLSAESASRNNVVELRARAARDTDDEGRLVPSAYLRTAMRMAGAQGAVARPLVMTVSGVSVGEYDVESRDERNGQRIVVHHVRAVRPRSDGRVLDLELRSLPRLTEDAGEQLFLRYGAANFADPDAVPARER